jgi:hypothetical protein
MSNRTRFVSIVLGIIFAASIAIVNAPDTLTIEFASLKEGMYGIPLKCIDWSIELNICMTQMASQKSKLLEWMEQTFIGNVKSKVDPKTSQKLFLNPLLVEKYHVKYFFTLHIYSKQEIGAKLGSGMRIYINGTSSISLLNHHSACFAYIVSVL